MTRQRPRTWSDFPADFVLAWCALTFFLLQPSCSVRVEARHLENEAVSAIARFHSQLNDGEFDQIYEESGPLLKKSIPRERVVAYLRHARDKFGAFKSVVRPRINVIAGGAGQARVVYNSEFTQGEVTELFVLLDEEGKFGLTRFEIFPGTIEPR